MEFTVEVDLAQKLASNQPKVAEKTLKKVGRWFAVKSVQEEAFTEDSLLKVWKGLFYFFWNSDKPLIQEDKSDVLCKYIHVFKNTDYSFLYVDTFFQTMAREWLAIDRYRLEKFMMLVRRFLHQTFQLLKNLKWELKWIKRFRAIMKKTVICPDSEGAPMGLMLHISDIYMEELAKVGADELTPEMTQKFLIPFCRVIIEYDEIIYLTSVSKDVFLYLINQSVDEEIFEEFPVLKFDATAVQNLLMKYANYVNIKKQNMRIIYSIIKQFEDYKNGVSKYDNIIHDAEPKIPNIGEKRMAETAFELYNESSQFKKKRKKKKKKQNIDL